MWFAISEAGLADTADPLKRRDTDDRFAGVADASTFAPAIDELASLARRRDWVAEEPQGTLGTPLALRSHRRPRACGLPGAGRAAIRQQAGALLGTIAEPAASMCEHRDCEATLFEIVTGIPDGGPFASHGHSLRLTLLPATS